MPNDFQNLLPLADLAEHAGTTPDYLRYLIFKGKLRGQKIGKIWFSRKEWIDEYRGVKNDSVVVPSAVEAPSTPAPSPSAPSLSSYAVIHNPVVDVRISPPPSFVKKVRFPRLLALEANLQSIVLVLALFGGGFSAAHVPPGVFIAGAAFAEEKLSEIYFWKSDQEVFSLTAQTNSPARAKAKPSLDFSSVPDNLFSSAYLLPENLTKNMTEISRAVPMPKSYAGTKPKSSFALALPQRTILDFFSTFFNNLLIAIMGDNSATQITKSKESANNESPANLRISESPEEKPRGELGSPPSELSSPREIIIRESVDSEKIRNSLLADLAIFNQSIRQEVNTSLNSFRNTLASVTSKADSNVRMITLSQKIDSLDGTTLKNITISKVSGLTDADIPNDITVTGSQSFTSLSLSGNFTADQATSTYLAVSTLASTSALTVSNDSTLRTLSGTGLFTLTGGLISNSASSTITNLSISFSTSTQPPLPTLP